MTKELLILNKYGGVSKGEGGDTVIPSDAYIERENMRRVVACWNVFDSPPMDISAIEKLVEIGGIRQLMRETVMAKNKLDIAIGLLLKVVYSDSMVFGEMKDYMGVPIDEIKVFLELK